MRPAARAGVLLALVLVGLGAAWSLGLFDGPPESPQRRLEPGEAREPVARYLEIPKVDVHVHVPPTMARVAMGIFREHGTVIALNASGGSPGRQLEMTIEAGRQAGGMHSYCFIDWQNAGTEDWNVRATLDACKAQGAVGVKVFKAMGLGYLHDGDLLAVDDPILDEAFEYAGTLGLPFLIHVGDPKAFFEPPTEDNERYEELSAHPSWSFYGPRPDGGEWPSWRELLRQFETRVARHPNTVFIGAHFGNAPEDIDFVGGMLERYDNYYVETGARVPEMGRHDPARMRALFERHQDRILFGTDFQVIPGGFVLGSTGRSLDGPERIPIFYESHWRYFETNEEDFEHPSPIQGDWTIDGIGLEQGVLEKVYQRNALRLFGLELPDQEPPRVERPAPSN